MAEYTTKDYCLVITTIKKIQDLFDNLNNKLDGLNNKAEGLNKKIDTIVSNAVTKEDIWKLKRGSYNRPRNPQHASFAREGYYDGGIEGFRIDYERP